jgi:hypothetical protein
MNKYGLNNYHNCNWRWFVINDNIDEFQKLLPNGMTIHQSIDDRDGIHWFKLVISWNL